MLANFATNSNYNAHHQDTKYDTPSVATLRAVTRSHVASIHGVTSTQSPLGRRPTDVSACNSQPVWASQQCMPLQRGWSLCTNPACLALTEEG
jgi:hypothetical protein